MEKNLKLECGVCGQPQDNAFSSTCCGALATESDEWTLLPGNDHLRFKEIQYDNPYTDEICIDYRFEIFVKPSFFGMFRKKRWELSIQTNSFYTGKTFSLSLLDKKTITF